jgi:hypothetical protein
VSWCTFRETLVTILRESVKLTHYLDNYFSYLWVEGQYQIKELSDDASAWKEDRCIFCVIAGVLRMHSCMPWLATLRLVGDAAAYNRTLEFMRCESEDVEAMDQWAQDLCKQSEENMEVEMS